VLSARRTTAQPDDEQDDGEDDESDQPREAEHRDQALRRPDRPSRAAGRWAPGGAHTLGRLFGLGLVEEVEFDVGVVFGHREGSAGRITAEAAFTLTRTFPDLDG